jgi:hypothetical protein
MASIDGYNTRYLCQIIYKKTVIMAIPIRSIPVWEGEVARSSPLHVNRYQNPSGNEIPLRNKKNHFFVTHFAIAIVLVIYYLFEYYAR